VLATILVWREITKSPIGQSRIAFGQVSKPLHHALIGAAVIGITLATYFGVNYAKFGTFNGVPVQYYNLYQKTPSRMQVTGGKHFHLENIPTCVATYFGMRGLRFERQFPWVFLCHEPAFIGSPAIDVVEEFSSFPVSMPALTLLALTGSLALVRGPSKTIRRARIPAITLLTGGGIVLMTIGITERYLHDFYPALIVCAAAGVAHISSGRYERSKTAVIAALTLVSVAFNCAFAFVYPRVAPWGVPAAKHAEFVHLQESIARILR
jgi:hypothetical protein